MSYCEFYNERKVKHIRKDRQCFGCGKVFSKGRSMTYTSGKFEGEFFANYLCGPCKKEACNGDYRDGFCFGDLREGRIWRVQDRQYKREYRSD